MSSGGRTTFKKKSRPPKGRFPFSFLFFKLKSLGGRPISALKSSGKRPVSVFFFLTLHFIFFFIYFLFFLTLFYTIFLRVVITFNLLGINFVIVKIN